MAPHFAAAVHCGAQYVVTDNLADFPAEVLECFDIEAVDADGFLSRTFDLYSSEALGVLRTLRETYSNPPFTRSAFVCDLKAKGHPRSLPGQRGTGTSSRGKCHAAGNSLISMVLPINLVHLRVIEMRRIGNGKKVL